MSIYRTATSKAGTNTANTVMWQIRMPASRRVLVREVGIFCEVPATTAPQFRLSRSLTLGTSSATVVPQPTDADSVATDAVLDTTWSAAPTFTTAGPFIDGWPQFNTAGAGVIYSYDDLWVSAGTGATSGLQVVNLVATGATTGTWLLRVKLDQ